MDDWTPEDTHVTEGSSKRPLPPMPPDLRAEVEQAWDCKLVPMHPRHPLNGWARVNEKIAAWVDLQDTTASSTDDSILILHTSVNAALLHEELFQGVPALLVVKCSDGEVLTTQPSACPDMGVEVKFDGFMGPFYRIPRNAGAPLGTQRPFRDP